jgi:hypothetical protein
LFSTLIYLYSPVPTTFYILRVLYRHSHSPSLASEKYEI